MNAYLIREEMTKLGWNSEDKITWLGWGLTPNGERVFGFGIWFERWDWHGKRCDRISYHAHTDDLNKIEETVLKAAELAKRAWNEFPECPPAQLADGSLNGELNKSIWKAAGLLNG